MQKSPQSATEPFILHKQIGSTLYKIGINFSATASETLDKKIRRLLINELKAAPNNATMDSLQAGWLSERGSLR
jgi:hypothetical protein